MLGASLTAAMIGIAVLPPPVFVRSAWSYVSHVIHCGMSKGRVGVRELRNHGSDVLARVQAGEAFIVTKSGRPVAELVPLGTAPLGRQTLIERWKHVPPVDLGSLREDIRAVLDDSV